MELIINGENKTVTNLITIEDLLISLKLKPETTAVEKNRGIIERNNYSTEKLKAGDVLELIRFMGGG